MPAKNVLAKKLRLRTGLPLKNRICKASMNEAIATGKGEVVQQFEVLYQTWANGGAGLLITGNMMVDGRHANEPLAVSIEDERDLYELKVWAKAAQSKGAQIWGQLSHPGKQSPKFLNKSPVAPSAIPAASSIFESPKELSELEIMSIITQFSRSAVILKKAGFDGVQLHAAHGYLISQFLSPVHNHRKDRWGGALENRMRFLVEIYKAVRLKVGAKFAIAVKLNSSDFQKGGFTHNESLEVCKKLDELGIDLIEISGGSWENPVNRRGSVKDNTRNREAYFLKFSEDLKAAVSVAVMVTGGFRSQVSMEEAVASDKVDIIGLARPFAVDPELANKILDGEGYISAVKPIVTGVKKLDEMAIMEVSWYTDQIRRISKGKKPKDKVYGLISAFAVLFRFWSRGQSVKKVRE